MSATDQHLAQTRLRRQRAAAKAAGRAADVERRLQGMERSPQLTSSSIDNGSLPVYDADGVLRVTLGAQPDGTVTVVEQNGPPPPRPTTPNVVAITEGARVSHDGLFVGAPAPADLQQVQVHAAPVMGPAPAVTLRGVMGALTGAQTNIELTSGQAWNVWLEAVNRSGASSGSSTAVQVTPTSVVVDLTDGIAPSTAPNVLLTPLGVGGLRVTWAAVPNNDAVQYRVYVGTDPAVSVDPANLYVTTPATGAVITDLPGNPRMPLPYDTDVYVIVVASDDDGSGPASARVSGRPRQATGEDIAVDYVYTGTLEAIIAQVSSLSILSQTLGAVTIADGGVLSVGDRIDIGGDGDSITIYARDLIGGQRVPLVTLSPDGNVFRGRVVADDISVLAGIELLGPTSKLKPGSVLTMENSQNPPGLGPLLTLSTMRIPFHDTKGHGTSLSVKSVFWEEETGRYHRLIWQSSTNRAFVDQVDGDGNYIANTFIELNRGGYPQYIDVSGLIKWHGAYYVFMRQVMVSGKAATWQYSRYTTGGLASLRTQTYFDPARGAPILGVDTLRDLPYAMFRASDRARVAFRYLYENPANGTAGMEPTVYYPQGNPTSTGQTYDVAWDPNSPPTWTGVSTFDLGSPHMAIHMGGTTRLFASPTLVEVTRASFSWQSRTPFVWRGGDVNAFEQFNMTGGGGERFSNFLPAADSPTYGHVAMSYTDGVSETSVSPISRVPMAARMFIAINTPVDLPGGIVAGRLYSVGTSASQVGPAALRMRAETIRANNPAPVLAEYAPSPFGSTNIAPPATGTFATGNTSFIRSEAVRSDGVPRTRLGGNGSASIDGLLGPGTFVTWPTKAPPPEGYLLCDGSAVSRLDYAELFARIGTTWGAGNGLGADNGGTFNLPVFAPELCGVDTITTTPSDLWVGAPGTTTTSVAATRVGAKVEWIATFTRSTAGSVDPDNGNLGDVVVGNMKPGWRPRIITAVVNGSSSVYFMSGYVSAGGDVVMTNSAAGVNPPAGASYSLAGTYTATDSGLPTRSTYIRAA